MMNFPDVKRPLAWATVLLLAFGLSGCASFLNEDTQKVTVRLMCKNRTVKATCYAENDVGRWSFTAPASFVVSNSSSSLEITCKAPSTQRFTVSAMPMPTWAMAGNLLAGGVIGAAVDIFNDTGLKYPENIDITHPACE
jgi:hypothetical protein